jgi:lambda repressor-like predicted transcriptional regulator
MNGLSLKSLEGKAQEKHEPLAIKMSTPWSRRSPFIKHYLEIKTK